MESHHNVEEPDFKILFEFAPDLYLILSPALKIVAVNAAYLKATMTSREHIIGRGIFEVFPDNPDDVAATGVGNLRSSLNRVLESRTADAMAVQKYDIPHPDGGFEVRYWSPLNTPVFGRDGRVTYIIHKVEDVTEFIRLKQKGTEQTKLTEELRSRNEQMEGEIFNRAQQLQEANQKLREAEKVKGEFFANVSHELRTPLSLILGPLESMLGQKTERLSDSQRTQLQMIHNNSIRLLQMVNGLLDFSKLEAGKMKVLRAPMDLASLVNSIVNDFDSMLRGKRVDISSEIVLPSRQVMLDRYLFERILFNLLSNAAKFTPEGGSVKVRVWANGDRLGLAVSDTGIGIAEADLPGLFQKFHQVEGSSVRRFEGTGLGLAMVKEFAELLGGTVTVESRQNSGTTFTVECLAPPTDEPESDNYKVSHYGTLPYYAFRASDDQVHEKSENGAMKTLICEDNDELAAYISSLLRDHCSLKRARDGEEALELVASWKPDLVLTDLMMPKKDGIEVCRAIKNNASTSETVVILLTALTHRSAMMKGWEAKADEYLFKPFHPEELVTRVRTFLRIISDRKDMSEIIAKKNRQLEYSNKELEAFSYSVSHDLRAPLRAIDGYTRILEEDHSDELNEIARNVLGDILANTRKMGQLIDDLLEFSHLNKKQLVKTVIDMNLLVRGLIDEVVSDDVRGRGVEVHVRDLAAATGDRKMIRQVWVNLISNAIKYSSKQEKAVITIWSTAHDGLVTYAIQDNGAGFDMRYYEKLFGVFERLHRDDEFEGTGVGLAIVSRIIAKHEGRVWAEGHPGKGATFYFCIPA